jgi:hypothetical protein
MPITRLLVAQDQEQNQVLNADNRKRFLVNHVHEWQFLFGPNSALSNSVKVLKLAAELDTSDLASIRLAAYLYNPVSGSIDNSASCTFKIYRVTTPAWTDDPIHTVNGTLQYNNYWLADVLMSSIPSANLDGDTTLMIEAVVTRLGETYRERIYVNHLGVYDSIVRLRNDVEFLDITKLDE